MFMLVSDTERAKNMTAGIKCQARCVLCDHFWVMLNSTLSLVWKHINLFGIFLLEW